MYNMLSVVPGIKKKKCSKVIKVFICLNGAFFLRAIFLQKDFTPETNHQNPQRLFS